jgi:hypothetical protein
VERLPKFVITIHDIDLAAVEVPTNWSSTSVTMAVFGFGVVATAGAL